VLEAQDEGIREQVSDAGSWFAQARSATGTSGRHRAAAPGPAQSGTRRLRRAGRLFDELIVLRKINTLSAKHWPRQKTQFIASEDDMRIALGAKFSMFLGLIASIFLVAAGAAEPQSRTNMLSLFGVQKDTVTMRNAPQPSDTDLLMSVTDLDSATLSDSEPPDAKKGPTSGGGGGGSCAKVGPKQKC
jgi:hypothetical protein